MTFEVQHDRQIVFPFHRLTEKEFFTKVDEAINEADTGQLFDVDAIVSEIASELR